MINYEELAEEYTLPLKNRSVNILRIRKIDSLFDQLLLNGKDDPKVIDEQMPYWADLWPSAIALSNFIDENSDLVKSKNVIEIGCGLGLPGIVAGLNEANVVLTDYLQEALDLAAINWKRNINSAFPGRLSDWRVVDDFPKADVIVASDVAYESRSFEPLRNTLKHLLKSDGLLLLSEPNRKFASPFIDVLKKEFVVEKIDKQCLLDGIEYTISIYICRNK